MPAKPFGNALWDGDARIHNGQVETLLRGIVLRAYVLKL